MNKSISSKSRGEPDDIHNQKPYADEKESTTARRDADNVVGEGSTKPKRDWQTHIWKVKQNVPPHRMTFSLGLVGRKDNADMITLPVPENFHDLVQIVHDYNSTPRFWCIPRVMGFPEFLGYPWNHRRLMQVRDHFFAQWMLEDQELFTRILRAALRSGRSPLHAPDYFYLPCYSVSNPRKHQVDQLARLFRNRNRIPGIEWNFPVDAKSRSSTDSLMKELEAHVDWRRFCDHLLENVPTAEFLFEPKTWDKTLFARTVIETNDLIPDRPEIVSMVEAVAGYKVKIIHETRWFGGPVNTTSPADRQTIRQVALHYWTEWRETSEKKLREQDFDLIQL
ncbi:hypothetical protein BT63DRAFT_411759 [Microthyrium microscopicum]|uniref:Uncharacterized protein n=1 Tax=Microthyrium microscopicum TaxID=703497 RepID=A0A6A6UNL9_9PEZI|nr:hypothetical protein BT63DRAFT_411759 [Microthyrium microscopicum]